MALGALAGAAAIQALGQYKTAQATASADKYNAQIAQQNAQLATQQAQFAAQEGGAQVEASGLQTRAKEGAVEANQGASGVEVGQGSFGQIQQSVKEIGMLDAMQIRANAVRAAYGYQTQAVSDKEQAVLDTYAAKNAKTSGILNIGSTVLSTAGQGAQYGTWLQGRGLGSNSGGVTAGGLYNNSPTQSDELLASGF